MAHADRRFDRSPIKLVHASARGKVLRNAGHYTRGSQLMGHQFAMFRAGLRPPIIGWLIIFVVIYWIMMSSVMGEHEIQLCSWRIGSAIWTWMDFDKFKPMNIVLADGSMRQTSMGYIPYLPDVQIAWSKALKTIAGSLLATTLISIPLITWFVNSALYRGSSVLDERHERGATMVDKKELIEDVMNHNRREFEKASAKLFPTMTPNDVLQLPFATRRAAGMHHPYSLADIPYPYNLEASHTIVIGTTGSGKTTQLRDLVAQMRKRQDSAVIFDLTGAFVEAFYDPNTDTILNPGDARCPSWTLFDDCSTEAEFTAASHAIVPNDGGNSDPFWIVAARGLFVEMCLKLQSMGQCTNDALARNLINAPLKLVSSLLKGTSAEPYTATDAAKLAESVRAVFNANGKALANLPTDGPRFSIRDWIHTADKPGSILFVTARHVDLPAYKMLLTLWLDIAVNTMMTLPRTNRLRTWFLFDELGALHRLPAIENGLQTARGFGGAMVLGLHSFARLQAVYGREGAQNLASLARTKLILATADRKTAELCSEFIGHREVRQMDEAYAYGSNSLRDASTLTPKKEVSPLVIPDDITNLPSLHGFIKFPDGFSAARVVLTWRDYPEVARGFEPRSDSIKTIADLTAKDAEGESEGADDGDEAQEGEGRTRVIEKPKPTPDKAKPKSRSRAKRTAADGKAGKQDIPLEQAIINAALTEAEVMANLLAEDLGSKAVHELSHGRSVDAVPEVSGTTPDTRPEKPDGGEDSADGITGVQSDTSAMSDQKAATGKPGTRDEEHRQTIIGNELNTDFGRDEKHEHYHHHHPDLDRGMEM